MRQVVGVQGIQGLGAPSWQVGAFQPPILVVMKAHGLRDSISKNPKFVFNLLMFENLDFIFKALYGLTLLKTWVRFFSV